MLLFFHIYLVVNIVKYMYMYVYMYVNVYIYGKEKLYD